MDPHLDADEPQELNGGHGAFWRVVVIGAALLALLFGLFFWMVRNGPRRSTSGESLAFGPPEQAYARQIHFSGVQMSRAENFLNQEITYISGTISNDGSRRVEAADVTVTFRDFEGKVALREVRHAISEQGPPLGPGAKRQFQFSFESVPDMWNQYYPDFVISGLLLR